MMTRPAVWWIGLVLALAACTASAQHTVQQIEYEIPVSFALIPEDMEFNSEAEEAQFILNLPLEKLRQAALEEGAEISEDKTVIYLDGNKIAVESVSDDLGRSTMVSDTKTGTMYHILWSQKKIIEVKPEDLKETTSALSKSRQTPQTRRPKASATGKKGTLYGFNCEQYWVSDEAENMVIWATSDRAGLVAAVREATKRFAELFEIEEGDDIDEWDLLPGKIPIEVRRYAGAMSMDAPTISVQAITKIDNARPSGDHFRVPTESEGYTKMTLKEMMMQYSPDEED